MDRLLRSEALPVTALRHASGESLTDGPSIPAGDARRGTITIRREGAFMAIAGLSAFKYTTDWEFETSEDTTGSFFGTVTTGRLILRNTVTDERMNIKYRCVALS